MRQYYKIKDRHPNAILLFRMGDFYETFEEDALTASKVLGIALTKRSNGAVHDVPLAGFPYHALDNHLPKLVRAGLRVAICEQLEDAKASRTVVKRGVVEVVTPGVSFHEALLHPTQSHYLAALHWGVGRRNADRVGMAFLDASTGEFLVNECHVTELTEALESMGPAEILFEKRMRDRLENIVSGDAVVTPQDDWVFTADFAQETLLGHFRTHSLKGFGVEGMELGLVAAGAVLYYFKETQKGRLAHVRRLTAYSGDAYMALDPQTKRNLELVASLRDGKSDGTLIEILDHTLTPMGGRLLRKWLLRPLRHVESIRRRQDAVESLQRGRTVRSKLRALLREVGDLERLAAKVFTGRASPRSLVSLNQSLKQIPAIKSLFEQETCAVLKQLITRLEPCAETVRKIDQALVDNPPATLREGGILRDGFNEELDALRAMARSGKDFVARMQQKESERTGIPSLKVGYNKVFGYYLEITNTHRDKVPEEYIRKQTLVNAERYITQELKEYEETILTAEEKIVSLEADLFERLRIAVSEKTAAMQRNAALFAELDCYSSFAELAATGGYCRPRVDESLRLHIEDGRHPVVEHAMPLGEAFIPNSVDLETATSQIHIITGPNMAGKSVVLRQVGLIVLLAQVGSFVPAVRAHIGVVDRIFTRVGASDNLAAGESTFLVEMNETANILHNATNRSLILLDEVGRGTSTFDGLSIAWALVEYLHENRSVAARTLFATHYHELNELAGRLDRVRNYRVQVQEHDGRVIFLRKLAPGGADHSYGIEVARMAGLPDALIDRARSILAQLETQDLVVEHTDAQDNSVAGPTGASDADMVMLRKLRGKLAGVQPNRLTPIEALLALAELKEIIGQSD